MEGIPNPGATSVLAKKKETGLSSNRERGKKGKQSESNWRGGRRCEG